MINDEIKGREHFRDLVLAYICGLQNEKYWRTECEGYKALQALLELIEERHGGMMQPYKG